MLLPLPLLVPSLLSYVAAAPDKDRQALDAHSEALADLERGLRLRPDDTDVLFLLAEAHSQTNNLPATRSAPSSSASR